MSTIGLVMIVKNEAAIIGRCLESVRPLLDYALIVDTGSTDDTPAVVRRELKRLGLDGKVLRRVWKNFAHNRSQALAELRKVEHIDYGFTIDADERLVFEPGFDAAAFKSGLDRDLYDLPVRNGNTHFTRAQLFSNRIAFVYKAVLHEYLEAPPGITRGVGAGLYTRVGHDGARSRNPRKFLDDAMTLEQALLTETDPFLKARYTFYLAQSYRDAGELRTALHAYLKRAEMGYWVEEVFISLYRAAQLVEKLGVTVDEQIAAYLRAYDVQPGRAEALYGAAKVCRINKRFNLGYLLAREGVSIPRPDRALFLDQSVYDFRMLDEFQICAYWAGHYEESLQIAERLLGEGKVPAAQVPRIKANYDFAAQKASQPRRRAG